MLPNTVIKKASQLNPPDKIGSYDTDDVKFILKDISGLIVEQTNEEREKKIQTGTHYSEMIPVEYQPSKEYLDIFYKTLDNTSKKIAEAVGTVSEKILLNRGTDIVLVSLARAGTPIGILIKRYIKYRYKLNIEHYSISIIRDKGMDENAIIRILNDHPNSSIQFIDGWTGKGVIKNVLSKACKDFFKNYGYELNPDLAVLADPAQCVINFGTREDYLIPSACLNSTVSGLISRTVLRSDFTGNNDYHGAKYYSEWKNIDLSNYFIEKISSHFNEIKIDPSKLDTSDVKILDTGIKDVELIQKDFNIHNVNFIKPGVGETTRVLLRRIPWKILVNDINNPDLKHILILAKDKCVPVEIYDRMSYSCCGIINSLGGLTQAEF